MSDQDHKIIIEGITENGQEFRPKNWAERLSGALCTYKKRRLAYSPLLQPGTYNGHECVFLDPALKKSNPALYQSILEFAQNNKLKMCGEGIPDADTKKS